MTPEREAVWKARLEEALKKKNVAKELFSRYEALCADLYLFSPRRVKNAKQLSATELQRCIDAVVANVCEHERLANSYLEEKKREEENVAAKLEEKQKTEARERDRQEEIQWNTEAIAFLLERKFVLGKDFDTGNAISRANDVAFEEEIERLKSVGPFVFDGQNCDDCDGWDGESRRCNCGHRRVYWARGEGHSFKNPHVYSAAD